MHDAAIARFLKANHPSPETICAPAADLGNIAGTDAASPEQLQVYCALFSSTRDLTVLRSRLDRQAKLMTSRAGSGSTRIAQKPTKVTNLPVSLAASSREILLLVQSSRQRLTQVQVAFPEAMRVSGAAARSISRQPQNSDSWK